MSDNLDYLSKGAIATQVAGVVKNDLVKREQFKSDPHQTIKEISGINNLSVGDLGGILDILLAGSNDGGGLLGDIVGSLLSGKSTENGGQNVIGALIEQVVGKSNSNDLITTVIAALLNNVVSGGEKNTKKTTAKKTTAKKSTSSKSTSSKTTTSKSTGTKKSTTKKTTSSKKKAAEPDLLGSIIDILDGDDDGNNNGFDITDLITSLLGK